MVETILKTTINYLVPIILGYLISRITQLKKQDKATKEALKMMLQNSLTNVYYVYEPKKQIPDYQYRNWRNMLKSYEDLGGDDYIHTLAVKMESWDIVHTDILT